MRTRERRERSEGRGVRTGPLVTTRRLRAETRRDTERHGETRRDTETEESGAGHTESSPGLDRWALTHQTRSPEPERDEIMNHNLCGYRISEEPFYYYSVYCTPVDVQKVENKDIFIQMCSLERIFKFHSMYLLLSLSLAHFYEPLRAFGQ